MLGKRQRDMLRAMEEHVSWQEGCGWVWDTPSGTRRLLEALERKGLVESRETNTTGTILSGRLYTLTRRGLAQALEMRGVDFTHRDRGAHFRRHGYTHPD